MERSHRTLDEECLNPRTFRKPNPREHAIRCWLRFYNTQCPHSALGWLTPLQKLHSFPAYRSVTYVWKQYREQACQRAIPESAL